MRFNKKAMSSLIAYLIMGLVVIGVMLPVIKYIKSTSDSSIAKEYGINTDDGFVPFDYNAHLSAEDEIVLNSINAFVCAVNSVASGKSDSSCGPAVKYEKENYVCCKITNTSSSNTEYIWNIKSACPNGVEDDIKGVSYSIIDLKEGEFCGESKSLNDVFCDNGGYKFGNSCVSCTDYGTILPSKKEEAVNYVLNELSRCWDISNQATKDIFCSWFSKENNSYEITKSDLLNKIKEGGYGFKLDSGFNGIKLIDDKVVICASNEGFNEVHINEGCEKAYNNYMTENTVTNYGKVCTVKSFELPQDVSEYGFDNSKKGWTEGWLSSYSAPKYVLYYEAFDDREKALWNNELGVISYGSMAYASMLNLGMTAIGAPLGAALKTPFKIVKGGITKLVPKLVPNRILSIFSRNVYSNAMKEFFSDIAFYGRLNALRKQVLKNADELKNVRAFLGEDMDGYLKLALESSDDQLDDLWDMISDDVIKNTNYNPQIHDKELEFLIDIFTKFNNEQSLLKYSKVDKLIGSYVSRGILKDKLDLDSFSNDLKEVSKGFDNLDSKQLDQLMASLEPDMLAVGLPPKGSDFYKNLFLASDNIQKKHIDVIYDNMARIFDQNGNIIVSEAEKLGITGKFLDFFRNQIMPKIMENNYVRNIPTLTKTMTVKYGAGMLLYLVASHKAGLSDDFYNVGTNQLGLGQPFIVQPKTAAFPENRELAKGHYLYLDKGIYEDGELGKARPRFYLASPCKTDIEIINTECSCNVKRGSYQLFSDELDSTPISLDSTNQEFNKIYLFDQLNDTNKKKVINNCLVTGSVSNTFLNVFRGTSVLDFDSAGRYCFDLAFNDKNISKSLIDFMFNEFFVNTNNYLKLYNNKEGLNIKLLENKEKSYNYSYDYGNVFEVIHSSVDKNINSKLLELNNSGNNPDLFWSAYFFSKFVTKFSEEADNYRIIYSHYPDKVKEISYIKIELLKLLSSAYVDENDNFNLEPTNNLLFHKFRCNNDICIILEDKVFFENQFRNLYSMAIQSENQEVLNIFGIVLSSTLQDLREEYNKAVIKSDKLDKLFGVPTDNKLSNDYILNKVARNYYFNYYKIMENEVSDKKIIKSCEDIKQKEANPLTEFINDPSELLMTSKCILVRPVNYNEYGQKYMPNYCFADVDMSDFNQVLSNVNTYGWIAVDIGSGAFGGPITIAMTATLTGALQYKFDQFIKGSERWPQHKGALWVQESDDPSDKLVSKESSDKTVSNKNELDYMD